MSARIAEYKIVSHSEAKDTEDEVNAFIAEGWEPFGELKTFGYGVTWSEGDDVAYVSNFSQAMVKRETNEFMHA